MCLLLLSLLTNFHPKEKQCYNFDVHPYITRYSTLYLIQLRFYTPTFYGIRIIICHKQFVLREYHISSWEFLCFNNHYNAFFSIVFGVKVVQQNEHIINTSFFICIRCDFEKRHNIFLSILTSMCPGNKKDYFGWKY